MTVHLLKCWPAPFAALRSGAKKHEVRKDDRAFAVGDVLRLDEWRPRREPNFYDGQYQEVFQADRGEYTGERLWMRVTYKSEAGTWGLPANLCVLSVEPCDVVTP